MLYLLVTLFAFVCTEAKLGCTDESGSLVDWYVLYKLPKNSDSENPLEEAGEAYAHLDADHGTWVGSKKSVVDPDSYVGYTYTQIIKRKKNLAYLLYNDELPTSEIESTNWGHTKGLLATDGKDGLWLVHSVPKFPNPPESGDYTYPESGKRNGQSFLCITFSFDQLGAIVELFRYNRPHIYSRHSIKELDSLSPEISGFFKGRPRYVKQAPWNTTAQIQSKGGQRFTVFGKHQNWGKDLYDALVAPALATSLYVQSWQVGSGTPLDTDCSDVYSVYNVEDTRVQYSNSSSAAFHTTVDHSKWAVAANSTTYWTCVGDINRMESQFKRGGGTVCLQSHSAWKAYTSAIIDVQECPV